MKIGESKQATSWWKHWLLLVLYQAARPFPSWVVYWIFCPLAATVAVFIPSFWLPALNNMRRVTRAKGPFAPLQWVKNAWLVLFYVSCTWADHIFIPEMDLSWLAARVKVEGLGHLRRARRSGRGRMVVTGHFPDLFLVPFKLYAEGFHIFCPVESLANPALNGLVHRLRSGKGVEFAPLSRLALRQVKDHLRNGSVVVMLVDRDIQGNGECMTFLGRPTKMPTGAARIAIKRNCLVFPATWERTGSTQFSAVIHPPIDPVEFGDDVIGLTKAMLEPIEKQILRTPSQWIPLDQIWRKGES